MVSRLFMIEKFLVYLWGLVLPWQTIWIYRYTSLQGVMSPYLTLGWYLGEGVLWVLFLVIVFNRWKRQHRTRVENMFTKRAAAMSLMMCAFPVFVYVRSFWSGDVDVSLRHALFIIEGYMVIVMISISQIPLREWLRAFLCGSVGPLALGLYQWFSQSTFSSTLFGLTEHVAREPGTSIVASDSVGRWLRAYGPFPHPNIFGGYTVLVMFLTYVYTYYVQSSRERITLGILHVVTVFVLCTTFSRGALLGYIVLISGWVVYALKNRIRGVLGIVGVGIVSAVCFVGIYPDLVHVRAVPVSSAETRSIDERISGIGVAMDLFAERPIDGYGGGVFTYAWYLLNPGLPGYMYQPVHVAPLVVLVEYGITGLVFALCSWVAVGSSVPRTRWGMVAFAMLPLMSIGFFDHYVVTLYSGILIFSLYIAVLIRFSTHSPQTVPMR